MVVPYWGVIKLYYKLSIESKTGESVMGGLWGEARRNFI